MPSSRDEADFTAFAAAAGPRLHRSAWLLTHDVHLAQDLVQATLLKLYLRWNRSDTWTAPLAYAQRVLYTSFCSWRGRSWQGEVPTETLPDLPGGTEPQPRDDEVLAALARLPRRQRAVVVARFYDDLSVEQAARLLGCSTGTIKSQTARALATLRAALAEPATLGGNR